MKRIIFFLLCNKVDTQQKKYVTIFQSNLDKLEKMEAAGQGCAQDFLEGWGGGGVGNVRARTIQRGQTQHILVTF